MRQNLRALPTGLKQKLNSSRYTIVLFAAVSAVLMDCNDKPHQHYTLLEVIDVKGTCYEDHVHRPDDYAGQIVRWQTDETKEISTYGSVTNTGGLSPNRIFDEVNHPTVYHTPFIVEFVDIRIDTNQPKWTLHGVSEGGNEGEQGYDSTCELTVIKRGRELPYGGKPTQ